MLAYGGIDVVIVTAGIFVPPDKSGRIDDTLWSRTFNINVTGAYIVADEAYKIFKKQGLPGNIVTDHERQRSRGEEGQSRLRHKQGSGQPPCARVGHRDGPACPRQRDCPCHGGERKHDVPA